MSWASQRGLYLDGDTAYLLGLLVARGTITDGDNLRQLMLEFPHSALEAQGIHQNFDQETSIRLGLDDIRERLLNLLDADITIVRGDGTIRLAIRFMRNNMVWRNILNLLGGTTSYPYFHVPEIILDPAVPRDWKREFVRGYADVAGNIRHANRYVDGRHRVRLDVLNYPTNWQAPVELCTLLQEHLGVPVQLITWGHPNLKRDFREHQINVFAEPFLQIGFSFKHKQQILQDFAEWDAAHVATTHYGYCPGVRRIGARKPSDAGEHNEDKLPSELLGKHFDAYWQICKSLGCKRMPPVGDQLSLEFSHEVEATPPEQEE